MTAGSENDEREKRVVAMLLTLEELEPGSLEKMLKDLSLSPEAKDFIIRVGIPLAAREAQGLLEAPPWPPTLRLVKDD